MSRIDALQMLSVHFCECFATTFGQSTLIQEHAGTAGRSMENERSFVDNPRRMYPTKRQTRQGRRGKGREAAPGEQEITSPDVRSFGFRAPRHRSWEKPALFFRERDARKKAEAREREGKLQREAAVLRVHDQERGYERMPRKKKADSAAVNIPGIRPVSKCTLGMRPA